MRRKDRLEGNVPWKAWVVEETNPRQEQRPGRNRAIQATETQRTVGRHEGSGPAGRHEGKVGWKAWRKWPSRKA